MVTYFTRHPWWLPTDQVPRRAFRHVHRSAQTCLCGSGPTAALQGLSAPHKSWSCGDWIRCTFLPRPRSHHSFHLKYPTSHVQILTPSSQSHCPRRHPHLVCGSSANVYYRLSRSEIAEHRQFHTVWANVIKSPLPGASPVSPFLHPIPQKMNIKEWLPTAMFPKWSPLTTCNGIAPWREGVWILQMPRLHPRAAASDSIEGDLGVCTVNKLSSRVFCSLKLRATGHLHSLLRRLCSHRTLGRGHIES